MTNPTPFGFQVTHHEERDIDYGKGPVHYDEGWSVRLPHSCEDWDITPDYWKGCSHEIAIQEMERFVAEAQNALKALREMQELNPAR